MLLLTAYRIPALVVIGSIVFLCKVASFQLDREQQQVNVPYNRATVLARVLTVQKGKYPSYGATLKVERIEKTEGLVTFAKVGDTIRVIPNYQLNEKGRYLPEVLQNKRLLEMRKARANSRVRAEIYFQGSEHGTEWYLLDVLSIKQRTVGD